MPDQLTPTQNSSPTPAAAPASKPVSTPRKLRDTVPADKYGWWWGTGRRKTAVARVRMRLPKDKKAGFMIESVNGKSRTVDEFFAEERDRADCLAPFKVTSTEGKFDVIVRVHGGGFMGQAGAVRLGVA